MKILVYLRFPVLTMVVLFLCMGCPGKKPVAPDPKGPGKKTEEKNILAEQDAQVSYETFMKDANDSVTQKMEEIVKKFEKLAALSEEKIQSEADSSPGSRRSRSPP